MEILGIGTDIVECPRIGGMIERHGELFLGRVFTEREIRACQGKRHVIEHFAGLWAGKQAVFKALGQRPEQGFGWTDLEIRGASGGGVKVLVGGRAKEVVRHKNVGDLLVSIAHCRTYATGYAMVVGRPKPSAADV